MDVELYVYDLSRGLARQFSLGLTGVQLDAIYHTSVVVGNVEYFFGQGIHRKVPGSTHHGRPMEVIKMGRTQIPSDTVMEYVQSLESIYTPESYDLFLHNCNNFSQDLSMFLVGKNIPEQIRTLPETFLRTPMGQMLRSQIDQSMRAMTQAPDAISGRSISSQNAPALHTNGTLTNGHPATSPPKVALAKFINGQMKTEEPGFVHNITSLSELDRMLLSAKKSCAVIFFTSATCPPCKMVYPAYDELASEAGKKAVLIKVDIGRARDIAIRYSVSATPTFVTFLKGEQENEWKGANPSQLLGNVRLLVQMASPMHPHTQLRLPSLQRLVTDPVMYKKVPPLDKLATKIGPVAQGPEFQNLISYVKTREAKGMAESPLPNLHAFSDLLATSFSSLPPEVLFAVVDLVRIAAADPRVSSFFVAESGQRTLQMLLDPEYDISKAAYNLQVVTLQLACNLFGSNVFQEQLLAGNLKPSLIKLASSCLLASQSNARALAAALVYNLGAYDHNERVNSQPDKFNLAAEEDLEAALVEAVISESESKESLHSLLLALGILLYGAPPDSSIWELSIAMEVKSYLQEMAKNKTFAGEPLLKEIGEELLKKGSLSG